MPPSGSSNLFPPARGASGPANGGFGSSILDGPPPTPVNPAFSDIMGPRGASPVGSMPPSRELPPEVLMGLLKAGESTAQMIDDMASMAPDIAPDLAGSKDLLLRALAKLTQLTGGGGTPALGGNFAGAAPLRSGPAVP